MVTASSLASARDSSEWIMASASASSTSLPISVSKMSGTGSAANSVVAIRRAARVRTCPVYASSRKLCGCKDRTLGNRRLTEHAGNNGNGRQDADGEKRPSGALPLVLGVTVAKQQADTC